MSVDDLSSGSSSARAAERPEDFGPLGDLPKVGRRTAALSHRLARTATAGQIADAFPWLSGALAGDGELGVPEVLPRASGLLRTGAVAQLVWTRLSTRVGIGLETTVAHALVDRLLGYDRPVEASRLQVTPVEWGVLTFTLAESLRSLRERPGPLGPWDLLIDRVSSDPFDVSDLGRVVTVRWPLRLGGLEGSVRLWLPETLAARWLATPFEAPVPAPTPGGRLASCVSVWHALAGPLPLPRGLKTLRVGGVLPLQASGLTGTPASPRGFVTLRATPEPAGGRFEWAAEPLIDSGGAKLVLASPVRYEPRTGSREAPTLADPASSDLNTDVPVTLTVELGRLSLTLSRLADLKPGDVVELNRHSREPVELTSGGRLVARGELVQIDTELGVRVTHVFL